LIIAPQSPQSCLPVNKLDALCQFFVVVNNRSLGNADRALFAMILPAAKTSNASAAGLFDSWETPQNRHLNAVIN